MLLSDLVGAAAGAALAVPALKDQFLRYRRAHVTSRNSGKRGLARFRAVVADGWEAVRAEYSGWDSLLLLGGSLGILLSFGLKLFDK